MMWMTKEHRRRCGVSLISREMQVKNHSKSLQTPRMARITWSIQVMPALGMLLGVENDAASIETGRSLQIIN